MQGKQEAKGRNRETASKEETKWPLFLLGRRSERLRSLKSQVTAYREGKSVYVLPATPWLDWCQFVAHKWLLCRLTGGRGGHDSDGDGVRGSSKDDTSFANQSSHVKWPIRTRSSERRRLMSISLLQASFLSRSLSLSLPSSLSDASFFCLYCDNNQLVCQLFLNWNYSLPKTNLFISASSSTHLLPLLIRNAPRADAPSSLPNNH